jgi:N-acylglucosamine-6-phosphate 2-epimerase
LNKPEILLGIAKDVIFAGAFGIRAEGIDNLIVMNEGLDVPVISLIKTKFDDGSVCITRKMIQIEKLTEIGSRLIAIDGTERIQDGLTGPKFISKVKKRFPDIKIIADISTLKEAKKSVDYGADYVATTLNGYTPWTISGSSKRFDFHFLDSLCNEIKSYKLIAEGRISDPKTLSKIFKYNLHSVVVGKAITDPSHLTSCFLDQNYD